MYLFAFVKFVFLDILPAQADFRGQFDFRQQTVHSFIMLLVMSA